MPRTNRSQLKANDLNEYGRRSSVSRHAHCVSDDTRHPPSWAHAPLTAVSKSLSVSCRRPALLLLGEKVAPQVLDGTVSSPEKKKLLRRSAPDCSGTSSKAYLFC
jgi:hypothetical protein